MLEQLIHRHKGYVANCPLKCLNQTLFQEVYTKMRFAWTEMLLSSGAVPSKLSEHGLKLPFLGQLAFSCISWLHVL